MRKNNILFIASFIMAIVIFGIQLGTIFLISDRFSFTPGMVGLFIAIGYGAYMAGCGFYRRMETGINVRLCIPLSVLIMTVSAFLVWISRLPWLTGSSWALFTCTTAFYWPPLMGWISSGLEGNELNRDLGKFNQAWSIGALLGPLTAGFLYTKNEAAAYLFFISCLAALTALLTISVLFHREMRIWEVPEKKPVEYKKKPESRGTPLRFPSWVGIFSGYAFLGVVINILPLEIRDSLGFSEQTAGNLLFIRGAASLVSFTILGKTVRWHFQRSWLLLTQGILIFIPILLLPGRISLVFYIVALILFGLFFSAVYTNSIFHGCAGIINKGGRMAVHEGVLTAGAAFGTFIGGIFYQHRGISGAVIFLTVLTFCGLMVSFIMIVRNREKNRV